MDDDGEVIIDYAAPCEFLDPDTRLCTVYDHRFETCERCGHVSLWTALADPLLPEGCAYARRFRPWRRERSLDDALYEEALREDTPSDDAPPEGASPNDGPPTL